MQARRVSRLILSTVMSSDIRPLLVVSYSFELTAEQAARINDKLRYALRHTTWQPLVIDAQSEGKVQAFGVDLPMLDTLSLDSIIDMLEALKRVREAPGEGGKAVEYLS